MARLLAIAAVLTLALSFASPAGAVNYDVTRFDDPLPNGCVSGVDCSLREAVQVANGNGVNDDILLDSGTYRLTRGTVIVNDGGAGGMTIDGTGAANTAVTAQRASRVFAIVDPTDDAVEFTDLTITGGFVNGSGGGVQNTGAGPLALRRSVVRGNEARPPGSVPTFAGGGGVHHVTGGGDLLTIEESTVSGNTATLGSGSSSSGGGGVLADGSVSVINSTLSGNRLNGSSGTNRGGGALYVQAGGTVRHTTFAGNSSSLPGGASFSPGAAAAFQNTIVSGGGDQCGGTNPSTNGGNLDSGSSCGFGAGEINRDPKLGPLGTNGASTLTHALLPGSDAIDAAGQGDCEGADQRGVARNFGDCDVGAYEFDGLLQAAIPPCTRAGQIPLTINGAPGDDIVQMNYKVDDGPTQNLPTPEGGSTATRMLSFGEGRTKLEYWGQFQHGEQVAHPVGTVVVDRTNPKLSIASEQNKDRYVIKRKASVDVDANDPLSGLVEDPSANGAGISTRSRGLKEVIKTATDLCGNKVTQAFKYRVLGPTLGIRMVIEPLDNGVRVKASSGANASQKGRRFRAVRQPREIRVGSAVDARKGKVRVTSSKSKKEGSIQDGTFVGSVFQVLQSRRKRLKGLTELRLKGGSFSKRCGRKRKKRRARRSQAAPAAEAARKRRLRRRTVRRLRSRARGRFRTRGRHSSATVRGTTWTTTDRCDGTLTKVKRGKVLVRDFRTKRRILLGRGKSYLAKAP